MRVMAIILPLARAATNESLSAVYARTFEKAAFGFAKVRVGASSRHCVLTVPWLNVLS